MVIEVDEHQHSGRECFCEQARMVNVSQSNGMTTLFIRTNPDVYKPPKGTAMDSTRRRLDILLEWVKHYQKTVPKDFLSVLYLHFDGYKYGEEKVQTILAREGSDVGTIDGAPL